MLRYNLYQLLERDFSKSLTSVIINGALILLIISNVAAVFIESYQGNESTYSELFFYFELFSISVFTIEYLVRLWICVEADEYKDLSPGKARIKHAFRIITLIDLIAIAPFFLALLFPIDLRYLRLMRLLRLLKLTHYFKGFSIFLTVVMRELGSISSAIFTMMTLVIIAAGLMFSAEHEAQPEAFGTIIDALWWSVVTMTTVGYGDVVPITYGGKLIASGIMLLGVGFVALPAAILAARFGEELQTRREQLKAHVTQAMKDGVISDQERQELTEMSEELSLNKETLENIIEEQEAERDYIMHCPHCNTPIYKD